MSAIDDFTVTRMDGAPLPLSQYRDRVLLIVNTAHGGGFAPQLAGLQQLHQRYGERGLKVLGFPCHQFGRSLPEPDEAIAGLCQRRFGVSFPLLARVQVKGPQAHPLFRWLAAEAPGLLGSQAIKGNFTKFLVDRDGRVRHRYAPFVPPHWLVRDIESALAD